MTDDGRGADTFPLSFYVARSTVANAAIPSLLGWDVLRYFELRTNWPQRIGATRPGVARLYGAGSSASSFLGATQR